MDRAYLRGAVAGQAHVRDDLVVWTGDKRIVGNVTVRIGSFVVRVPDRFGVRVELFRIELDEDRRERRVLVTLGSRLGNGDQALSLAAFEFLRRIRIARNAVSLGGVETLTCHPKSTTHSGMTEQELAESGVTDGLVRVSVGIEDWRDLLADFEQALSGIE